MSNSITIERAIKTGEQLAEVLTVKEVHKLILKTHEGIAQWIPVHVKDPASTFPIASLGVYYITIIMGVEPHALEIDFNVWVIADNSESPSCENCANYTRR